MARDFSLRNCIVRGTLTFNFVTFGESVSFTDTVFEGGISLTGCKIQCQFVNVGVEFWNTAEFEGLSVGGHAYFERVVFKAAPNFAMTSWGPFTTFNGTKFDHGAAFLSATFGGHAVFENDTQATGGPIDLTFATINGMFLAHRSRFEQSLLLVSVRTAGAIRITETEFGPEAMLSLYHARIGGDLEIKECRFLSASTCLYLDGVQVDGGCSVGSVSCRGGTYAQNARFRSYLAIGGLQKRVDGEAQKKSQFDGAFSLSGSKVDDSLNCTDAVFKGDVQKDDKDKKDKDVEPEALFTGMKVGDDTYIIRCNFKHGAKFHRSQFTGVFGTDSHYDGFVSCQNTRFHNAVRFLPGCTFERGADFYFCTFDEEANFGGATIRVELTLQNCEFRRSLLFVDPTHKSVFTRFDGDARLQLTGSTYGTLEPATADSLQQLIGRIPNVPTEDLSLVFLEQWLRRSGRQEEADMVRYHCFERRSGRLAWWSRNWWQLSWNRFYRASTGYGTVVWPVLVVALLTGAAALAVTLMPGPDSVWKGTTKAICTALATSALGLGMEPVKRRLWPQ